MALAKASSGAAARSSYNHLLQGTLGVAPADARITAGRGMSPTATGAQGVGTGPRGLEIVNDRVTMGLGGRGRDDGRGDNLGPTPTTQTRE
jgi:hypothetical protein